jgi:hypothetical protein
MRSIGDFFKRIGALQNSELGKRSIIHDAIQAECHIDISVENITIKGSTISIDVSHMEKSIIKLHTQAVLARITTHQALSSVRSII